jgi:uncharacterized delta-60 repeat protein
MARVGKNMGAAALGLVCSLALAALPAKAEFTDFLVPGTRSPIVIAERPFALTGIRPDGSPNLAFGRGGSTRAHFTGVADLCAEDAATQPDGKIVVAGFATRRAADGRYPRFVAVARFRASGRPDNSFGEHGVALVRGRGRGSTIVTQRDGGLLVGGAIGRKPMLLRLRADGSLDRRFGGGGVAIVRTGTPQAESLDGSVTDLVSLSGGGVVVAVHGSFGDGQPESSMLVRYGPGGRLDKSFGDGGAFALDLPGVGPNIYSLVARPQGGMLAVAATLSTQPIWLVVVGIDSGGRLDRSYGRDGRAFGPSTQSVGFDLGFSLGPRGGAAFAVPTVQKTSQWPEFEVARLTPAGKPLYTVPLLLPGLGPYSVVVRPNGGVLVLSFDVEPPHQPLVAGFVFDGDSVGVWPGPGQTRPR